MSLIQHVATLLLIKWIPSQKKFALILLLCLLSGEVKKYQFHSLWFDPSGSYPQSTTLKASTYTLTITPPLSFSVFICYIHNQTCIGVVAHFCKQSIFSKPPAIISGKTEWTKSVVLSCTCSNIVDGTCVFHRVLLLKQNWDGTKKHHS